MPEYLVIMRADQSPQDAHRKARARNPENIHQMTVEGTTIESALRRAKLRYRRENNKDARIVSIEEIAAWNPNKFDDARIAKALTEDCEEYSAMLPEDYDDVSISTYMRDDFHWLIPQVAQCLRESELVPGLEISLIASEDGPVEYAMVEIYDPVTGTYRSAGAEPKHLIDDRSAEGFAGLISIARALMRTAAELM